MKPDFSGWATKNDLLCTDGRTIRKDAFKHMDKKRVPLVWSHKHDDNEMVLGHAILENRAFGVYAYGFFNDTPRGKAAKEQVLHGDIDALSIWANGLRQVGNDVVHGDIRELSLVLAGANIGAVIENVYIQHGADLTEIESEAIIYTGLSLQHDDTEGGSTMAEEAERTVQDVYNEMSEEQKNVVHFLVGEALEDSDDDGTDDVEHDGLSKDEFLAHIDTQIKEGFASMNIFEQNGSGSGAANEKNTLSHDQIGTIMKAAPKYGSVKESFLEHAGTYGIDNIEALFPDAKTIEDTPQFIARRMEWVKSVVDAAKHLPFAKVKSVVADITPEEARAKGYTKGNEKKEEVFALLKRTTSPATIYKKQKLDRDDVIDITDLDVIAWMKAEMRIMLEEELGRAILIGDGRSVSDEDKIKDPAGQTDGIGIRSIANDHVMYAHQIILPANVGVKARIEAIIRSRSAYRGSGSPTLFTTDEALTDMLLLEDKVGRRLYESEATLASTLRVSKIVTVEVMADEPDILGIIVNMSDYSIGTNRGGQLAFFDDFDIDFNQMKYLYETRLSGALTRPKSAIVIRRQQGTSATPAAPTFNSTTNTITIVPTTGIDYLIDGDVVTGNIVITEDTEVVAESKSGYYIPSGSTVRWNYTYTAG